MDQYTLIDKNGKKIKPTILDEALKNKNKNNPEQKCIYGNDKTCFILKYIKEQEPRCVLSPDIDNCGESCPYFIKQK